ncbi:transcriptional regulator [Vibrio cyclitrophicus]|uniref:winged helix-turn-helix domain-containing protein n=1 Tax=unclassified Vibrio TaxID=2614977 RepID=UPI00354FCB1C
MTNKCPFYSCKDCIENNQKKTGCRPIKLYENNGSSNKHQRLLCLLGFKGEGAIFSTDEIKEFVWPNSIVGESSVPQLVHHAKKLIPDGYDIICIRNRGYLLVSPNAKIFTA